MTNWKYCTPEQGKRLVELGIEVGEMVHYLSEAKPFVGDIRFIAMAHDGDWVAAFDCAELSTMLPHDCHFYKDDHGNWFCDSDEHSVPDHACKTAAYCMAETLIIILEDKTDKTTAAECNARLKNMNDE